MLIREKSKSQQCGHLAVPPPGTTGLSLKTLKTNIPKLKGMVILFNPSKPSLAHKIYRKAITSFPQGPVFPASCSCSYSCISCKFHQVLRFCFSTVSSWFVFWDFWPANCAIHCPLLPVFCTFAFSPSFPTLFAHSTFPPLCLLPQKLS